MSLCSVSRLDSVSASVASKNGTILVNSEIKPATSSTMRDKDFLETHDLESWIIHNREILFEGMPLKDDEDVLDVMIITTQFNRWGAGDEVAWR